MKMREWRILSLCGVTLLNGLLVPSMAQDVSLRLTRMRAEAALRHIAADLPAPGTGGTQSGEVKATPSASGETSGNPSEGGVTATYSRRPINVGVGGRMGFDKQTVVIGTPAVAGTVRRRIRTLDVSLDYPLSNRSSVFLTVPYIDQRTSLRSPLGNGIASGRGLGDIGIYLQRRFTAVGRGTDLSATFGLVTLSVSKLTSPFIDVPGTTVGYLSQSLTYQANQRLSWRGAVDVGLTEDSTDAYFGLSVNSTF
jgi:hypothetical protein